MVPFRLVLILGIALTSTGSYAVTDGEDAQVTKSVEELCTVNAALKSKQNSTMHCPTNGTEASTQEVQEPSPDSSAPARRLRTLAKQLGGAKSTPGSNSIAPHPALFQVLKEEGELKPNPIIQEGAQDLAPSLPPSRRPIQNSADRTEFDIEAIKTDQYLPLNEANCKIDQAPGKIFELLDRIGPKWRRKADQLASKDYSDTTETNFHSLRAMLNTLEGRPKGSKIFSSVKKVLESNYLFICDPAGTIRAIGVIDKIPGCMNLHLLVTSPFNFSKNGARKIEAAGAGREALVALVKRSLLDPETNGCVSGSPLTTAASFYEQFMGPGSSSWRIERDELNAGIQVLYQLRETQTKPKQVNSTDHGADQSSKNPSLTPHPAHFPVTAESEKSKPTLMNQESDLEIENFKANLYPPLNERNCKLDVDPKKRFNFLEDLILSWQNKASFELSKNSSNSSKVSFSDLSVILFNFGRLIEDNVTGNGVVTEFMKRTVFICDPKGTVRAIALVATGSHCTHLDLLATSPYNFENNGERKLENSGAGREAFVAIIKRSLNDPESSGCVSLSPLPYAESFYSQFIGPTEVPWRIERKDLRVSIGKIYGLRENKASASIQKVPVNIEPVSVTDPIEVLKTDRYLPLNENNCKLDGDPENRFEFLQNIIHEWENRAVLLKNKATSIDHSSKSSAVDFSSLDGTISALKKSTLESLGHLEKKRSLLNRTIFICDTKGTVRAIALTDSIPRCLYLNLLIASPFNFADDGARKPEGSGAGREAFIALIKRSLNDSDTQGCITLSPVKTAESFYSQFTKPGNPGWRIQGEELKTSIRKLLSLRKTQSVRVKAKH